MKRVHLVQRGVWAMETESMPLAMAYLKAIADADDVLSREYDIRLFNFGGADGALDIVTRAVFGAEGPPDILAFSVLGWNFHDFGRVAELYKDVRPDGLVIFGGNHVTSQATRTFGIYPAVDVIVNGEGEMTFCDLLRNDLAGVSKHELHGVPGVSFKEPDGTIVTTEDRERLVDLDVIPSPMLSGTVSLRDENGKQRYDVVLMETNRGCPYKCSFCYWGGAIGQRLRKFSMDRIAAELDFVGYHQISDVVLCDSNFGMLKEDSEFIETLLKMREKHGFPRNFETSWAKNKNKTFYSIVRRMKQAGVRSSFTLALQSLSEPALELMQRKNMKLNDWQGLAEWLKEEQLESYAEIIWGLPGETYESFLDGYDRLSEYVSRIAVYPLLLMPNTTFSSEKERFGFVLLRGENDDFEYVLAHDQMSFEDNRRMHKFIFWARVVAENQILRYIWRPLRALAGIGQVELLQCLDAWTERQTSSVAKGLLSARAEMVDNLDASRVTRGIHYFYLEPRIGQYLEKFWIDEILPRVSPEQSDFFLELLRYDVMTRPIYQPGGLRKPRARVQEEDLETTVIHGEEYYVRPGVIIRYDVPRIVDALSVGESPSLDPEQRCENLYFRTGFATHIDNHEFVSRYTGRTRQEIERQHTAKLAELAQTQQSAAPPIVVEDDGAPLPRKLPVLPN